MEIHNDAPIKKYDDDIFDRKPIADKLAAYIQYRSQNSDNDSFCIGVYGKWGEGKTSLANMTIEKLTRDNLDNGSFFCGAYWKWGKYRGLLSKMTIDQQNKIKDNIVIAQYNPWLLKDQESILYDFFNTVSNEELGAKTVELLKEYGAIVSLGIEGVLGLAGFPLVGKAASFSLNRVVKALPNSKQTVSELKKKVNESLKASGKHLVIFVDDLDRLDREEIHAVLKLIRQNTDFVNTTYILMMDYYIVSSSLQTKYTDGNKYAGQEFLSKIVQFPLHLPQIQEYHLERFLSEKLESLFSSLDSTDHMYKDAIDKAKSDIEKYVLPLFSTPREIIQYINILSFVVPTMYKELNLSDLCLLEAVKKFSNECYKKIRENKNLLLDISFGASYIKDYWARKDKSSNDIEDEKKEIVKSIFLTESDKHNERNKHIDSIIEYLLEDFVKSRQRDENIYKNRLCNIIFFDKYFIYDTPVDILSEKFIDDIGHAIENNEEENLIELFNKIHNDFRGGEIGRIVRKLIDNTIKYSPDKIDVVSTTISLVLSKMEISNKIEDFYNRGNGVYETTIFKDILNKLYIGDFYNEDRNYPLIKSILEKIYKEGGLIFSLYMYYEYLNYNYLEENYKELLEILIRRLIKEKGELEIFNFRINLIKKSLIEGYFNNFRAEFIISRDKVMNDEKLDVVKLIYSFVMKKSVNEIENLKKYFDIEVLYNKVKDLDLTGEYIGYKDNIDFFIAVYKETKNIKD